MLLGLACVSSGGVWIAATDDASRLIASRTWNDSETSGLSTGVSDEFETLLQSNKLDRREIRRIGVVTGPGAFTGLRIGSAFAQGLAAAIDGVRLVSIPTSRLAPTPFWIPLKHQSARHLTLDGALAENIEFLRIDTKAHDIGRPVATDTIFGLKDNPFWPSPEQLLGALRLSLGEPDGLALDYGLEPKISGQRAP